MDNTYIKPFRIFGNLYFVGTRPASTHLIDTGDGLILIDSGYKNTLWMLINNIWELGFSPRDIKYILHTHGHIDHIEGTKSLVFLSGAKTFINEKDAGVVKGTSPLSYDVELNMKYEDFFEPDVLIHDGDEIKLGNTVIKCVHTPGHTEGTTSFFFDVTDGKTVYRAAMPGGVGANSMQNEYLDKYGLPHSLRKDFVCAMEKIKDEKVDIFLGNHVWNNKTQDKAARLTKEPLAFVDPSEWKVFIEKCRDKILAIDGNN